jgi:hypothetical protein
MVASWRRRTSVICASVGWISAAVVAARNALMARSLSRSARTASAAAANDRTSWFVTYAGDALAGAACSDPVPGCAFGASSATDVSSESSARS